MLGALAKESEIVRKHDLDRAQQQYEEFLREIEESPEMRAQIKIFKAKNSIPDKKENTNTEDEDINDEDFPQVKSDELLDADDDSGDMPQDSDDETNTRVDNVEVNINGIDKVEDNTIVDPEIVNNTVKEDNTFDIIIVNNKDN